MSSLKSILAGLLLVGLASLPVNAQGYTDGPAMRLNLSQQLVWFAQSADMALEPTPPAFATVGEGYDGGVEDDFGDKVKYTLKGSLPSGLTASGSVIRGVFDAPGVHTFSVEGKSTAGQTKQGETPSYRIEVLPAVELHYGEIEVFGRVNNSFARLPASVSGARGAFTVNLVSGSMPGGIVKAADGSLSGSFTAAGSGLMTLEAQDNLGRRSVPFTINWQVLGPLQMPVADRSAISDIAFSYGPQAVNTVGDVSYSLSGVLPEGLAFDEATGRISGVPSAIATSASGLRITVADSLGQVTSQPFSIDVSHAIIARVTGTTIGGMSLQSLFSSSDWSSPAPKMVVVEADAIVASTSTNTSPLRTGSGWGGKLQLVVKGSIQAAGGMSAGAGGGNAIQLQQAGLDIVVEEDGEILAGGGAGGNGGVGGQGYSTNEWGPWSAWRTGNGSRCEVRFTTVLRWDSSNVSSSSTKQYECGALLNSINDNTRYYAIRMRTTSLVWGVGGSPGSYGIGRGYNQARTNGGAGSAGSGGGGTGGSGGTGGDWGMPGSDGHKGGTGSSSGANGSPGGPAGAAIYGGYAYTLDNKGSVVGAR